MCKFQCGVIRSYRGPIMFVFNSCFRGVFLWFRCCCGGVWWWRSRAALFGPERSAWKAMPRRFGIWCLCGVALAVPVFWCVIITRHFLQFLTLSIIVLHYCVFVIRFVSEHFNHPLYLSLSPHGCFWKILACGVILSYILFISQLPKPLFIYKFIHTVTFVIPRHVMPLSSGIGDHFVCSTSRLWGCDQLIRSLGLAEGGTGSQEAMHSLCIAYA